MTTTSVSGSRTSTTAGPAPAHAGNQAPALRPEGDRPTFTNRSSASSSQPWALTWPCATRPPRMAAPIARSVRRGREGRLGTVRISAAAEPCGPDSPALCPVGGGWATGRSGCRRCDRPFGCVGPRPSRGMTPCASGYPYRWPGTIPPRVLPGHVAALKLAWPMLENHRGRTSSPRRTRCGRPRTGSALEQLRWPAMPPSRPPNAQGRWFTDEGELFVNRNGAGLVHRREREEHRREIALGRHQSGGRPARRRGLERRRPGAHRRHRSADIANRPAPETRFRGGRCRRPSVAGLGDSMPPAGPLPAGEGLVGWVRRGRGACRGWPRCGRARQGGRRPVVRERAGYGPYPA